MIDVDPKLILKKIKDRIETLKNDLEGFEDLEDLQEAEIKLKQVETKINDIENLFKEISEDEGGLDKPLITDRDTQEREFDIRKNEYNKIKLKWDKQREYKDLEEGKLTGADAHKATKNLACDNLKEVDNQGILVERIGENIKTANDNLEKGKIEITEQGEQMNIIQDGVNNADAQAKQTGKILSRMEGRAKCIQVFAFLAVILMGITDIALLGFGVYWRYIK